MQHACAELKKRIRAHPHVRLGHGSKDTAHVRVDTSLVLWPEDPASGLSYGITLSAMCRPLCTVSFHFSKSFEDLLLLFGIDVDEGTSTMHNNCYVDWIALNSEGPKSARKIIFSNSCYFFSNCAFLGWIGSAQETCI